METPSESNTTASEQSSATPAESVAPPGMSEAAVKRVTADSPLEPNKLEQVLVLLCNTLLLLCNTGLDMLWALTVVMRLEYELRLYEL